MTTKTINTIFCVAAFFSIAALASAHVPFLKPNQFHVLNNRLVIESSFTEFPFQADFAMTSPRFWLINPAGDKTELAPVAQTKGAVYLEPTIAENGTYRISTGVRKGPVYRGVETSEGKLYFSDDTLRFSGRNIVLDYYNSADVYVAKGEPDYSPNPLNQGVEIVPLTSPNRLCLGGKLSLRILNNGSPVANARMVVAYDNEHYEKHRIEDLYDVENVRESTIYADSDGIITFVPRKAGLVLLFVTIHEKKDNSAWSSYNTSLTLETLLPENDER